MGTGYQIAQFRKIGGNSVVGEIGDQDQSWSQFALRSHHPAVGYGGIAHVVRIITQIKGRPAVK